MDTPRPGPAPEQHGVPCRRGVGDHASDREGALMSDQPPEAQQPEPAPAVVQPNHDARPAAVPAPPRPGDQWQAKYPRGHVPPGRIPAVVAVHARRAIYAGRARKGDHRGGCVGRHRHGPHPARPHARPAGRPGRPAGHRIRPPAALSIQDRRRKRRARSWSSSAGGSTRWGRPSQQAQAKGKACPSPDGGAGLPPDLPNPAIAGGRNSRPPPN